MLAGLHTRKPGNQFALVGSLIRGPLYSARSRHFASSAHARFRPTPTGGKKPNEFRWVTTFLTADPTEDTTPRYFDWEACASLYVAVDILTHHDGIRHSGLKGHPSNTARGLLFLVACMLRQFL